MRNPITVLKLTQAFLSLVKDPNQLEMVFKLSDKIDDPTTLQPVVDSFEETTYGIEALRTRFRLGKIELDDLAKLPPGTLGYEFSKHMNDRKLKIEDIPTLPGESAQTYVKAHLYETHDIWHVVTGFDTDVAGELGLQAFYLAQIPTALSGFLLASGFLNTILHKMDERENRNREIQRGLTLGSNCKPLAGIRWSDFWTTQLSKLQKDLGIKLQSRSRAQYSLEEPQFVAKSD